MMVQYCQHDDTQRGKQFQNLSALCVIHLYKVDLNFLLGLKWKEAMYLASEQDMVHRGQFGGRPGQDPTTITLLEELCMNYSQMTRTPFVNFDHDAKSCYDRILMPLGSLAARGYGIHRQVVFVHDQTLEQAIYKLKFFNKVTGEAYRHCKQFPNS